MELFYLEALVSTKDSIMMFQFPVEYNPAYYEILKVIKRLLFQFPRERLPAKFNEPILLHRSAEFAPQDKFRRILFHSLYLDFAALRADFDPIAGFDLVA